MNRGGARTLRILLALLVFAFVTARAAGRQDVVPNPTA
jgi:hypothetical protein